MLLLMIARIMFTALRLAAPLRPHPSTIAVDACAAAVVVARSSAALAPTQVCEACWQSHQQIEELALGSGGWQWQAAARVAPHTPTPQCTIRQLGQTRADADLTQASCISGREMAQSQDDRQDY